MATAESLQRLASGLLERMRRRLGDGKGRREARVQPRPTRWRSGGVGEGRGVARGKSRGGQRQLLENGGLGIEGGVASFPFWRSSGYWLQV